MKKILFLITQSEYGGAQRYIYEICRGLNPEKYEVLMAAGEGDGELFRKCQMSNVKCQIFSLKYLKRTPWPWQIILAIREIYNLLKKEKPDVLFLCSTTAGLLGSISAFLYKLFTVHRSLFTVYRIGGWAFRDPRPFLLNKIILLSEKFTARWKDKIIVNSEIDRQLAIKHKIAPAEKVVKIYNGIDISKLEFLPREEAQNRLLKPGFNRRIIGCVANFYKTKGLVYLIEAAYILNTKYKILNTKYLVIGEGRQRPELEALIKKYKLENVVFLTGRIPDSYKYLKSFDIFVLPSLKEGFPWIILEAMAAELPIIATNVGAIPEIIEDGKDGILIEPKKSQLLAEKIAWLFENHKYAKNMGIQSRQKIKEKFTLQKMLQDTETLLR